MKLSNVERLMLINQFRILEIQDSDYSSDYSRYQTILEKGFEYLYGEILGLVYPDDQVFSEDDGRLVVDILSMYRAITFSLKKLKDKTGLNEDRLKFKGFDGNHETGFYSFSKFYCTGLSSKRFEEIGTGEFDFESSSPMLETYERMLNSWNQSEDKNNLTIDDLKRIENEWVHPD